MDLFKSTWNFVCRNREHLDCEIFSATRTFLTNKCFLFSINCSLIQGLSSSSIIEGNLKIIMNDFSEEEVIKEMKGFVYYGNTLFQDEDNFELPGGVWLTPTSKSDSIHPKPKYRREHRGINLEKNCHICDLCGKEFVGSKSLWMHKSQVHQGKNHQCTVCLKSFNTSLILKSHIKQIHEGHKFSCIKCQKVTCINLNFDDQI